MESKQRTNNLQVLSICALVIPLLGLLAIVSGTMNSAPVAVGGALVIAVVTVALQLLARRVSRRLVSAALPRATWAAITVLAWSGLAGVICTGIHFTNVDAGIDDSAYLLPAALAAVIAMAAAVAALVLGVVTVRRMAMTSVEPDLA